MSTIKDRAARDMIIRARTNLLVSNGFFGFLAMQLRLVEVIDPAEVIAIWGSEKAATMAVDGVSMFYAPPFVHKLSERECEGVIAHEVMHCCFQHFTRRQKRDAKLWNIAGDYVINGDIIGSGFVLPGKPMSKAQLLDPNYREPGYMLDPLYKGSTTEEVYDDLYKDVPKVYVKFGNGDGKGVSDPGGCGGVMDAPGDRGKQDAIQQGWEASVRAAVAVAAANNVGQIPGSLRNLIENLNRPKVSWRDLTRRFIDQSMIKEISWSRLSRRSVSIGCLMPGMISDRLNKLVFFVDISGSVSHDLAREMISEVAGALDQGTADCIVVAYADTQVQHVDVYMQGDVVTCGRYTGGGTDFRDSFQWLAREHPDASCVIYLTDLQVNDFGDNPGCPVMWAVYGPTPNYAHLSERAPFGECIHVSNSYG